MLEDTLAKLADSSQPLTHKLLRQLSGLTASGIRLVQASWPGIPSTRRQRIAEALLEMAEDDAELDFVDVFRALMDDPDDAVRAAAVSGLWESNDERLVEPMIRLMSTDPAASVRAAAASNLGHFCLLGSLDRLHSGRDKHMLAALLQTFHGVDDPLNTADVRGQALTSMAYFEDDEVSEAIEQAYDDLDITLRIAAVVAMGITADESWEAIVLNELDSPDAAMRFEATRAAAELALESAVPHLAGLTSDPDPEVRLMAISALGEIGGGQAKAVLTVLLESHDEATRDAAEEALEELNFGESPLNLDDLFQSNKGKRSKN
jgi:HEAT repeat protein